MTKGRAPNDKVGQGRNTGCDNVMGFLQSKYIIKKDITEWGDPLRTDPPQAHFSTRQNKPFCGSPLYGYFQNKLCNYFTVN